MITAGLFLLLGSALQAGSVVYSMFAVARFIAGIGSSIGFTVPPVFISELAPPHSRGKLVSFHVVSFNCGYLISALASLGFSYISGSYQWRLNFAMNTVAAVALIVFIYFVPESPRWLVSQDRVDEATQILMNLRKTKDDPSGSICFAEIAEIQQEAEATKNLERGYRHILRTPSHRKRALCTLLVWFTGMSTGVMVIAVLSTLLFAGLGYNSSGSQFALSAGWLCCCILSAAIGGFFVDRGGRVLFMGISQLSRYLASISLTTSV